MRRWCTFLGCCLALTWLGPSLAAAALLDVGEVAAPKGATVEVEVTFASDLDVTALQFDLVFDNNRLAEGTTRLAAGQSSHQIESERVAPGRLRVVVFALDNSPIKDGSMAFIPFQVGAQVDPGQFPLVMMADQAILTLANGEAVSSPLLDNGLIQVDPGLGIVQLGGRVRYFSGDRQAMSRVSLQLMTDTVAETQTDDFGRYRFDTQAGSDYTLVARELRPALAIDGLDIADLHDIRKHILAVSRIENPLGVLAADVDFNRSVDESDLEQIRDVILGRRGRFDSAENQEVNLFQFVSSDLRFPNRLDPWQQIGVMGENVTRRGVNLTASRTNEDFAGFKLGDVNGDWGSVNLTGEPSGNTGEGVYLAFDSQFAFAGEEVELPLRGWQVENVVGFQFEVAWDPEVLEYVGNRSGIFAGVEGVDEFDPAYLVEPGRLKIVWDHLAGEALGRIGNDAILSLVFRAIGGVGRSTRVELSDNEVPKLLTLDGFESVIFPPSLVTLVEPDLITTVLSRGRGLLMDFSLGERVRFWALVDTDGRYVLEASQSIPPIDWVRVDEGDSIGGVVSFIDDNAMEFQRYYRVVPLDTQP